MVKKRTRKKNIWNIPNPLSMSRIIASPILAALVFRGMDLIPMIILFTIAALTDFLDGFIARKYNQVTDFGRKLDMIADRVLMISIVFSIFAYAYHRAMINPENFILIWLIMSREIISAPVFIAASLVGGFRPLPHARFAGKLMTLMQGITFPIILLGWRIAFIFAIITCAIGIVSAGYYIYDCIINPKNKFQTAKDIEYRNL